MEKEPRIFETILDAFKDAENGDIQAMFFISTIYECDDEYGKAFEWCTKAAEKGHNIAQFFLG